MFHVEQYLAWPAALLCAAAAAEQAYTPLPLSGDSEPAALECNLGLQDTLMGDHELAAHHFTNALKHDENCALARCGSILLDKDAEDYAQRLNELQRLLENYTPTPAEALFINSLLKLACNEVNGAAADFRQHAEQHRNDVASTCWAVSLLHLTGKTKQAAELADEALARHPGEVMLLYLRGAVEETADSVSDQALHCAQAAAILMRDSAQAEILYGKLLFKRGYTARSIQHFHVARQYARRDMLKAGNTCTCTYLLAGLNEATALSCSGRDKEALALRRNMNAEKIAAFSPEAAVLYQWETATLPLRSLIHDSKLSSSAVKAAVLVARRIQTDDKLYGYYIQCLEECLLARCTKNSLQAESRIASAKLMLKHLNDAPAQRDMRAVVMQRAKYAAAQAIASAQSQLYRDDSQAWYENIDVPADAAGRYLLPIVPRGTK